MPFEPTFPPTAPVFAPTTRPVDMYYMQVVNTRLKSGDPSAIEIDVEWFEGFDDGGMFVVAPDSDTVGGGGRKSAMLSGPTLVAAMNQLVTPGKSHYDDFRDALWTYMMDQGLIPPGTIT
jgi:hypothetical protein